MGDPPEDPRMCDDGEGRHVWLEPFEDGNSCECGAWYLDQQPGHGVAVELKVKWPEAKED